MPGGVKAEMCTSLGEDGGLPRDAAFHCYKLATGLTASQPTFGHYCCDDALLLVI